MEGIFKKFLVMTELMDEMDSVPPLTVSDVHKSITTRQKSEDFVERFLSAAIYSIMYNRFDYDPHYFKNFKLDTIDYKDLSRLLVPAMHSLHALDDNIKNIVEDIKNQVLKEFAIIIRNNDMNVIEHYSFIIGYVPTSDGESIGIGTSDIMKTTTEVFKAINYFGDQEKLKSNDSSFVVQTDFNNDEFELLERYVTRIDLSFMDSMKSTNFGKVITGFHKIEIYAKGGIFSSERNDPESLMTTRSQEKLLDTVWIDCNRGNLKLKTTGTCVFNKDDNIECLCELKFIFPTIPNIRCTICNKLNHLPCCGYQNTYSIPASHICYNCHKKTGIAINDTIITTASNDISRNLTCLLRLMCVTIARFKTVILLDYLNKDVHLAVWVHMALHNLISTHDGTVVYIISGISKALHNDEIFFPEPGSGDPFEENNNVVCLCEISYNIPAIPQIMCTICRKYQHVPCCGYKILQSVPEPHVCYNCHKKTGAKINDIRMHNEGDQLTRLKFSLLRLTILYCSKNHSLNNFMKIIPRAGHDVIYKLILLYFIVEKDKEFFPNPFKMYTLLNGVLFYKEARTLAATTNEVIVVD